MQGGEGKKKDNNKGKETTTRRKLCTIEKNREEGWKESKAGRKEENKETGGNKTGRKRWKIMRKVNE